VKKGLIIVISAPSGTGKGTVIQKLRELRSFSFSVSHTTRAPRTGEVDGVNYHYVSRETFESLMAQGKMVETTVYSGNYYGTSLAAIEDVISRGEDVLLEIEVEGGRNIRKKFPEAVEICLLPPSLEELERRLRGRGTESEEVVCTRLSRAREELAEVSALPGVYDYYVVNRDVDEAARTIADVLHAEEQRLDRQGDLPARLLEGKSI
jgi:guanylate kinase